MQSPCISDYAPAFAAHGTATTSSFPVVTDMPVELNNLEITMKAWGKAEAFKGIALSTVAVCLIQQPAD